METVEGLIGLMLAPDSLSSRVAIAQSGVSPEAIGRCGRLRCFHGFVCCVGQDRPGPIIACSD